MSGADTGAALLRYGTAERPPERRRLEVGPLRCVLEAGAIRHLLWRDVEILRGVAFLLRDRDWGTPAAEIDSLAVEQEEGGVLVRYAAHVPVGDATFRYTAHIRTTTDGGFAFTVEGMADGEIATNRCGFVLLHPAGFAGLPLEVTHTGGAVEQTRFPQIISPSQPVFDIRALRYAPAEGLEVTCTLEAALPHDPAGKFEMEDQRNWSDASFKTYVGSLLDPWPYRLAPGQVLRQRVSVRVVEARPSRRGAAPVPAATALRFGTASTRLLPAFGLGVPQGAASLTPDSVEALAMLRPRWLVVAGDLSAPGQQQQLAAAAALAERCGAAVQLELIVPTTASPAAELADAAVLCAAARLRPAAVLVCPQPLLRSFQPSATWPALPPLEAYYAAARTAFPSARIGGGAATYFTELNRKRPTGAGIDFISHTTAPIVHAADDHSVMETLETLPHMARSVRALWPGLGYRIGPSSLAMRSNPYGETTAPNPDGRRLPLAARDPRQAGLFAAAWTVGYAAALAAEGLEMLALHNSHGPSGVLDEQHPLPVFHVMRALASASGAALLPIEAALPGLAALAWQDSDGVSALVANLTEQPLHISLPDAWQVLRLDVQDCAAALHDVRWLDASFTPASRIDLGPFAIAFLRQAPA